MPKGLIAGILMAAWVDASASTPPTDEQALAANAVAVFDALEQLGAPLPAADARALRAAAAKADATRIQELLDPRVLVTVSINPEARVKAARGDGTAALKAGRAVPVLLKVVNDAGVTAALNVQSPQADPADPRRAFDVKRYTDKPLAAALSGRPVEYAVVLVTARQAGRREATLAFDAGQGTQDLGFRGEVPVLFTAEPAP